MISPSSSIVGRKRSYEVKQTDDEFKKKVKIEYDLSSTSNKQHYDPEDSEKCVRLSSGALMPFVQFGTYKMKGDQCYTATLSALQAGYRGVDTASVYDNEKEVGRAVSESGVPRDSLFIQTKLWRSFVGMTKSGRAKCDGELRKSLKKLGVSYVDLWLIHWPGPGRHLNYPPVRSGMSRPKTVLDHNKDKMAPLDWTSEMRLDTYKEMAKFVSTGEVKHLGVCNFSVRQLTELLEFCDQNKLPRPVVVQNECHPLLLAEEVREFCNRERIVFQAYASLGAGSLGLLQHKHVVAVSERVGVSPAQVLLRWGLQHGCSLLPKSVNSERQISNLNLWGFKLDNEDMDLLNKMDTSDKGQNTMAGWLREHDPDFY